MIVNIVIYAVTITFTFRGLKQQTLLSKATYNKYICQKTDIYRCRHSKDVHRTCTMSHTLNHNKAELKLLPKLPWFFDPETLRFWSKNDSLIYFGDYLLSLTFTR